jgi:hypothetical protein
LEVFAPILNRYLYKKFEMAGKKHFKLSIPFPQLDSYMVVRVRYIVSRDFNPPFSSLLGRHRARLNKPINGEALFWGKTK